MKWYQVLWELPQTFLGLVVKGLFIKDKQSAVYNDRRLITFRRNTWFTNTMSGVSLGYYILLPDGSSEEEIAHEYGHCMQSKKLGCFYLLIVGLPSICNNIWDRIFHKKWTYSKRISWYYNRFPEKQADRNSGVIWENGSRVLKNG